VNYGPNSGLTARELVARDELVARFREAVATLRPETRAAIAKNLEIMQAAANEIDAALAKDPASGMLKGMLVGTYKREMQLYSTVVTSGDGLTRRT
jgi:Asp-tRNA(Asn)/Glu-tRNA(Gln) amidotransferase A subunit family amidase